MGAGVAESHGDRAADAAVRAGHERDAILELHAVVLPRRARAAVPRSTRLDWVPMAHGPAPSYDPLAERARRVEEGAGAAQRKEVMFEGLFRGEHLLIILVIVLILFGPSKLPGIGAGLGKSIRDFKKAFAEPADEAPRRTDTKPTADEHR